MLVLSGYSLEDAYTQGCGSSGEPSYVYDILAENDTVVYEIDGFDFEVWVKSINDLLPSTAEFSVNGEETQPLGIGEIETLPSGASVLVLGILYYEGDGGIVRGAEFVLAYQSSLCHDFSTCEFYAGCSPCEITPNETCNGIDDNCDGEIDENLPDIVSGSDVGVCQREIRRCEGGSYQTVQEEIGPSAEICDDDLDNDCNGVADDLSICPLKLTINYVPDKISTNRTIKFNISASTKVGEIFYIDFMEKTPRERMLCRDCGEYGFSAEKTKSFRDGLHNVTFYARNGSINKSKSISFLTDSKAPKIRKTYPARRKYTNGTFVLEWEELNMEKITLHYGGEQTSKACGYNPLEKTQSCTFTANINQYDGRNMTYWFDIKDVAGNKGSSKPVFVYVDTTRPVITQLDYYSGEGRVYFNISASEEVNLKYLEAGRENTFCLGCGGYLGSKFFPTGGHNLLVRAIDDAGNKDERAISFDIS
ncbi:putative metal-binding motif-containing protein [Candidatus Woesearchaeota archaeon]|nr:putative metal-binding motif-containing protein [Candidatus Woesearchaeota archaeon]